MFLSVIIPAYNEEKRLPATLKKVKAYLEKQSYDWEVLIVNDGSRDRTAEVVGGMIENPKSEYRNSKQYLNYKNQNIKLINNKANQGKGAVVKQGMLAAKGEWRLFMDADNSTDISELPKLWKFANLKSQNSNNKQAQNPNVQNNKHLENSNLKNSDLFGNCNLELGAYDIVIGSRYLKSDSIKIKQPLGRRLISRLGNWLIRILLGLDVADTQCGFKLFSAKATADIFPKQTISRWGFDMEILAIAKHRGYQIKEVAVDWYDAAGSQVKKSAAFKTLKELITIKWNLMRGKYK
jgi:glycosyltransferase involved in cell wall biosynthesis